MIWQRQGHIFKPAGDQDWARTHAQVPRALKLSDKRLRIYYCSRDVQNRSHSSYIDVDPANPGRILYEHPQPILELGAPGSFDDCGIMPSTVLAVDDKIYFYYVGWNRGEPARYRTAIGLAISEDGGDSFSRVSRGPIMDRSMVDPVSVSCQAIQVVDSMWQTWYMSYLNWVPRDGQYEPRYRIHYAESSNGIEWSQDGSVALDLEAGEGGLACPSVIVQEGEYRMWYSVRGDGDYRRESEQAYCIREAVSSNGRNWRRTGADGGLNPGEADWEDEMTAYPSVYEHAGKLYMLYNGNGFGRSGFGYAVEQVEGSS